MFWGDLFMLFYFVYFCFFFFRSVILFDSIIKFWKYDGEGMWYWIGYLGVVNICGV